MKDDFQQLDPQWAWAPFEPSPSQPWNRRSAAHLYRRSGFAGNQDDLDTLLSLSPEEAVERLVTSQQPIDAFEQSADALARTILAGGDPRRLSAAWVYRLLHTPNQVKEKVTLFWHGHFATSAEKVKDAKMMWNQNGLLREHGLGEFAQLVQAIAQDPAMLVYLDSTTNRKSHPNENFARELMELFCLGEGNYSERDVQELARCFTGWEVKNGRFRKNPYQQDPGNKSVLGVTGKFDGEEGVRVVLDQPAMPLFICRKLVRFYVCDEPIARDELLRPLADEFRQNGLQIAPIVKRVLSSNLFFSPHAQARKIRSPVELIVGLLRCLEGTTNTVSLASSLADLGQGLFFPPNVKGWDGGRAWINSSTLLGRANLVERVLSDPSTRFAGENLSSFFDRQNLTGDAIIDWLMEMLLAVPTQPTVSAQLASELVSGTGSTEQRLRRTLHAMATLPEFQLG